MRLRRRDLATAEPLKKLWRLLPASTYDWKEEQSEAALVLGDALNEQGFPSVGSDLSRFAKRMTKWEKEMEQWRQSYTPKVGHPPPQWDHPKKPKSVQWRSIRDRVDFALKEIEKKTLGAKEWHQRRPRMATIVLTSNRYFHSRYPQELRPELQKIEGPFPITPKDAEDITTLRKWLAKHGHPAIGKLSKEWREGAYHEVRKEGSSLVVRPRDGPWRIITIELGRTRPHLAGRTVAQMTKMLTDEDFAEPHRYARMLYKAGFTPERLAKELNTPPDYSHAFAEKYGFRLKRTSERDSSTRRHT